MNAARWSDTPRWARAVALVVGLVLTAAALKLGRPVLVPIVAGAFLAVLAAPLDRRLRAALPGWLALLVTMLVIVAVVAAFAVALGWSVRSVAEALQERRDALRTVGEQLQARASRFGLTLPRGGGAGAQAVRPVLGTVVETVGGLLLALALAALGLAERRELRDRLHRALSPSHAHTTMDAIGEIAQAFRRYVWVKSLTSVITGTASALLALALGLPLAFVWGFLAFLLEYVPSVGSAIAVLPPTLMALAEAAAGGDGYGRAGLAFAGFGILQVTLGNVVDPRIEGKLMALSPLGVLLSIVVWGWLWGAAGALLAVPLTVAIVLVCRRIPGARGVATVLAGDGDPPAARD
jgi:predicted PurR-regulated permease PerM